jgi:hypothetical protein
VQDKHDRLLVTTAPGGLRILYDVSVMTIEKTKLNQSHKENMGTAHVFKRQNHVARLL